MLRAVVNDPFWVPIEQARKLTDLQKWELFIGPKLREQRREDERLRAIGGGGRHRVPEELPPTPAPPPDDPDAVVNDQGQAMTGEAVLMTLVAANLMRREDAQAVIAERHRMMEEEEGDRHAADV